MTQHTDYFFVAMLRFVLYEPSIYNKCCILVGLKVGTTTWLTVFLKLLNHNLTLNSMKLHATVPKMFALDDDLTTDLRFVS